MATLTQAERVLLRKWAAQKAGEVGIPIYWTKDCLHSVAQAVEDVLASAVFKTQVSDAINATASPYGVSFTATEKRWLVAFVLKLKYVRDLLG